MPRWLAHLRSHVYHNVRETCSDRTSLNTRIYLPPYQCYNATGECINTLCQTWYFTRHMPSLSTFGVTTLNSLPIMKLHHAHLKVLRIADVYNFVQGSCLNENLNLMRCLSLGNKEATSYGRLGFIMLFMTPSHHYPLYVCMSFRIQTREAINL